MKFHVITRSRVIPTQRPYGFTIIELLTTAAIISVIFAAGSAIIVSHIKQTATQESVRRLQDEWGRLNHFMATEINESSSIVYVVPNTSVRLMLPGGGTITYTYDLLTKTLTREGPRILSSGKLDLANPSTTVDLMNNVIGFYPTQINSRELSYSVELTDGRGNLFTGFSSGERTRSFTY